jgi:hypothetical protein
MKNGSILIVLLFILCASYLYFKYVNGWLEFRKNTDTPRNYLNHTTVNREGYSKDSAEIVRQLKSELLVREDFFHNSAFFDSTQLFIDSIV